MPVLSQERKDHLAQLGGRTEGAARQRLEKIKSLEHLHIATVNERIALMSTLIFGSMWMFYAFFIYGFLPLCRSSRRTRTSFSTGEAGSSSGRCRC